MAAPYVSAAVAVIRSLEPALTPVQVAQALVSTSDDLGMSGRDDETGAGLIDPVAAACSLGHCPDGVSPSPGASPSPTASGPEGTPTSAPTSAPSSSPTPSPSGAPAALGVWVARPASPVVSGGVAVLTVTVSDAGGPVSGAVVRAVSGDRSVRAVTGASGVARLAVAPARTATWTVIATAAGHVDARRSAVVPVVPRVAVRWRGSRVTVTVRPAAGQVVTVWTRGSRGWVRRSHRAVGSGTVTLAVPAASAARITVSAGAGLSPVTVTRSSRT
jgi:hypothetical protein